MENKEIVPVYELVVDENVEPLKRKIKKTMEVTEEFTMFDVMQYIAKLDKAIADKKTEIQSLETMREAYMKEIVHVESQTNVNSLEEEWLKTNNAPKEITEDGKENN